ncbi:hypothetical protein MKZ38_006821 [Zalerion maritima]|uniref:Uncharacterized protein n=1 Tax=Zalerion maritima TaxID=339359 RepID=A0AAD5RV89_9PEZI|nr:hypothetical protein MKZ38_006821 [Zalerion maritima]
MKTEVSDLHPPPSSKPSGSSELGSHFYDDSQFVDVVIMCDDGIEIPAHEIFVIPAMAGLKKPLEVETRLDPHQVISQDTGTSFRYRKAHEGVHLYVQPMYVHACCFGVGEACCIEDLMDYAFDKFSTESSSCWNSQVFDRLVSSGALPNRRLKDAAVELALKNSAFLIEELDIDEPNTRSFAKKLFKWVANLDNSSSDVTLGDGTERYGKWSNSANARSQDVIAWNAMRMGIA